MEEVLTHPLEWPHLSLTELVWWDTSLRDAPFLSQSWEVVFVVGWKTPPAPHSYSRALNTCTHVWKGLTRPCLHSWAWRHSQLHAGLNTT